MKNTVYFLLAMLLLTGVSSCKKIKGKGDVITENRNVSSYQAISLSFDANLNFRPDSVYSLSISAQENLLEYIETNIESGTLVIKIRDHYFFGSHDPITVNISAPEVNSLGISGSGNINTNGPWMPGNATLNISGSGNIVVDTLSVSNLKSVISGSGYIRVNKGTASSSSLNISGSGTIHTEDVKTGTVNASISGSGDIYCWAVQKLNATISGSGSIYYRGNPQIETNISGSGNVRPL
jgi:hypothetical protein